MGANLVRGAKEALSKLFRVSLTVVGRNADIDFESVVGQPAHFGLFGALPLPGCVRHWYGICNHFELQRVEATGLSTYHMTIVPVLWLLTQRRNHRIFQQMSEPEIVLALLKEWDIKPAVQLSSEYKARKYRAQYGESDHAFISRMLEDAGITYYFEQTEDGTRMVLSDAPQANPMRKLRVAHRDEPSVASELEHVTNLRIGRRLRPGRYTMQDHDYRRSPSNQPRASAAAASALEKKLERFHYTPGAFLYRSDKGDPTPTADDRGMTRTDDDEGKRIAQNRLDAKRNSAKICTFETNAHDLAPGVVMGVLDHPRADLAPDKGWLVAASSLRGKSNERWSHACELRNAELPFRPPVTTEKPRIPGVETATVVGPPGEEIHTDEFGRVRVHFHWDRESRMNEESSCWLHVNQPWGGAGYGGTNLPRIGQEVIVDFVGGDPDRPIITGRIYTNLQKTPYSLPANKTQSGWKSNSSPTTGGYNEIMFEDKAGEELVRMQAEKNLHKLVKNDEEVKIGNDRNKEVGRDDFHKVGNDRSKEFGHDDNHKVGNDRNRQVGNNETVNVGNNESRSVGANRSTSVGGNENKSVGGNKSSDIGKSLTQQIGESLRQMVGNNKSEVVANNRSAMIGNQDSMQAAQKFIYQVPGGGTVIGEPDKLTLSCGAASIVLEASGKITIDGKEISMTASSSCDIKGDPINLN
jgi:type VI secretion system secreted protein VgrG